MIIRPVTRADKDGVLNIAKAAGIGMTSLPPDIDVLAEKIERAAQSFEDKLDDENDALYFFVLEDPDTGEVAGTCGIEGHIGLKRPMYSYKVTTVTQYSDTLDIFSRNEMLQMVNDYTGSSEMVSLFLAPEYRRDRLGRFLSRVRFLFMALFPEKFDTRTIAEIRGWNDGDGHAPFYDGLAKHFFQIEFEEADKICATQGNRFISELMPTYPIYANLLPKQASATIGRPHIASEAAKAMLEREGFHYNHYIDIFDGGPTLEAKTSEIRTVKNTKRATVKAIQPLPANAERMMLATPSFASFRAAMGRVEEQDDGSVIIDNNTATLMKLTEGDEIAYVGA